MSEFEVVFYDLPDGSEPAKAFILSLNPKMRAKTLQMIKLLQDKGHALREPYSKALTDGIFELRIAASGDISRVLYFFVANRKAILTNGFIKKTNKTPAQEIAKAISYRREYLHRKERKK